MEWVLPIETKLGERLERRIDSRWEVNGRSLGQNQYVNFKIGGKSKTQVLEDTWKCHLTKGHKNGYQYQKVERKSIFARLKEAGKWWEGER